MNQIKSTPRITLVSLKHAIRLKFHGIFASLVKLWNISVIIRRPKSGQELQIAHR